MRTKRRDMLTVAALIILVLFLGAGLLNRGHEWGDDFAAYMMQARAIANGTMEEQGYINRVIHASRMDFSNEGIPDTVTYVWGYPLVLSVLYKAVGFNFGNGIPILYKLPNLIAYALFIAAAFLFYRRRFPYVLSLFLSLLMALNTEMVKETNVLMTDIPCLALSMISLLLMESFLECNGEKRKIILGAALGTVLWYNYEVRLNGVTVILIVLMGHAIHLMRTWFETRKKWVHAVPYAVFLVLLMISMWMLPVATSNSAHIASGPRAQMIYNIGFYKGMIDNWFYGMIPTIFPFRREILWSIYVLIAIGIICSGIYRNLHLTTLLIGTFGVLLLLPYVQSLRYAFNALPLLLLFAGYGLKKVCGMLNGKIKKTARMAVRCAGYAVMMFVVCGLFSNMLGQIAVNQELGGKSYRFGAYSDDALDIYAYIRENTAEEAKIACCKPRALMLNTDRVCYVPGINGNLYKDMDYLLTFEKDMPYDGVADSIWPELWEELTPIYRNDTFTLYELSDAYKSGTS